MSSKVQVFVSSTMKDLANERDAVARKISAFNFEPVNAESWLPDGSKIWDRIHKEILSSHLFVLIVGERYGWIPKDGPGASEGLSVTHMEVNAARAAKIPILIFLKDLDYDCDRDSEDAKKRDNFREEISRWSDGAYKTTFKLASDLSEKVGASLVGVLSESYLNAEVRRRSLHTVPLQFVAREERERVLPALDPLLIDLVRKREAVLLAGAGMSLSAGFPSAQALVELLVSKVVERKDDFSSVALSGSFQEVSENFERAYGRPVLLDVVQKALIPPQGIEPTRAHHLSVRLFKTILTTNFDRLFESACEQARIRHHVLFGDVAVPDLYDETLIVKVDGSIADPTSLVLTSRDALKLREAKSRLWQFAASLIQTSPVIIVGHSLRDLNTKALLESRDPRLPGYIVAPDIGSFDDRRFTSWGFRLVRSNADAFFESLASAV